MHDPLSSLIIARESLIIIISKRPIHQYCIRISSSSYSFQPYDRSSAIFNAVIGCGNICFVVLLAVVVGGQTLEDLDAERSDANGQTSDFHSVVRELQHSYGLR